MIKMTVGELVQMWEALQKVMELDIKNGKVRYRLGRILKASSKEFELYNEIRNKKVMEYGTKISDDSNEYKIDQDKMEAFNIAIAEILKESIEVNANKITVDDLDLLPLSPKDSWFLDPIIEEETDYKKVDESVVLDKPAIPVSKQ
jgi:hypothetical protein